MQENKLFPGRENYTGPTTGWFGLLHHEELCEQSHDVNERIAYVRKHKPENEVAIRLHNMIYLGGCPAAIMREAAWQLCAETRAPAWKLYAETRDSARKLYDETCAPARKLYEETCAPARKLYEETCAPARKLYEETCATLNAEILAYIKLHIPDCAWNGQTLVF
jgi:vacuolar-type H+-ATPase subunit H